MPVNIKMREVFDFDVVPHPKHIVRPLQTTHAGGPSVFYYEKAGRLQVDNIAFPHMHVMNMGWETGNEDLVLFDEPMPGETVNINFQMSGMMHTTFPGLHHDLDMRNATHNLVYIPDAGDMHRVRRNQTLSLLHISIDKTFFVNAIGNNDAWSEKARKAIASQKAFSGMTGTVAITPQMQQLIHSIHNCGGVGSMRNLLVQSRVLELLTLQIDQFTKSRTPDAVNDKDADKLRSLKCYLDEHFLDDLSLAQLSKVSLLNEFKLKKGFKTLFGSTVFNYIRNLRMQYAMRLLKDTSLTIDEVADITGYEHQQHFSTAFKKHFGVSPSCVRK